jgi:hypothetical protein
MTLFPRASTSRSTPRGGNEPFSSPLLREVVARFGEDTRHVILELGVVNPGALELLQGRRCRLLVADACLMLSELDEKLQEVESPAREVERLIVDDGREKVDTVLCWDLLNYLSPPLLNLFAARLASMMAPTGIAHAYIHTANANMPQHPQRYAMLSEDLVVRLNQDPDVRKAPRYSFGELNKHASALRVDRSMLLRNGLQEYLLRLNPQQA